MPRTPAGDLARRIRHAQGARLRAARLRAGKTQKSVAESSAISQVRLSAYELGQVTIPDEVKVRLSIALDESPDELFSLEACARPRGQKAAA